MAERALRADLAEQIRTVGELTAEARALRKTSREASERANKLARRAEDIARRTWVHEQLLKGAISACLADGRLVTLERQGSTHPPQTPRVTISEPVVPDQTEASGSGPVTEGGQEK